MAHYLRHGIRFSSSHPLPGLTPTGTPRPEEFHIVFRGIPADLPATDGGDLIYEKPAIRIYQSAQAGGYHVIFRDGCQFLLDGQTGSVQVYWPEPQTFEDAAAYAVGPVLSLILRLRGRVCLHASAVEVRAGAILFVGPSSSGKSTLAAAMAESGAGVLGDDIAVIGDTPEGFVTHRSNGGLCLLRDAAVGVFGTTARGRRRAPHWPKLRYPASRVLDAAERVPVAAIYLPAAAERCTITSFEPMAALHQLMGCLHPHISVPLPTAAHAQAFDLLSRVAVRIPVKRLGVPRDFVRLPQVCAAIRDDVGKSVPARQKNETTSKSGAFGHLAS